MAEQKSGDEIERVFKVRQIPIDIENYPSESILQGYLAIDPTGAEVRLRKTVKHHFETIKGSGHLQRRKLEIRLSREQFDALGPGTEGRRIEKIRYKIDYAGRTIELNLFRGDLEGLALAKSSLHHARKVRIQAPDWLGDDLTEDSRYKNQNLAQRGAPNSEVMRQR